MLDEKKDHKVNTKDIQIVLDSIRRIVRALRYSSKYTEKKVGLSTAQIFVLQKIAAGNRPLSINELAKATLTHQSSVSVVASKLVNQKFVDRITSKTDSRSVELSINKRGKYALSKSPPSVQDRLMKAIAQLNAKEKKGLVLGLQTLIQKSGLQNEKASMLLEEEEIKNENKKR